MNGVLLVQATSTPAPSELGSLFKMIVDGGPVMIPIGLCSVLALGFLVERLGALGSARLIPSNFRSGLDAALAQGEKAALEFCEKLPKAAIARIFAAGLRRFAEPRESIERAVADVASGAV